MQLSEEDRVLIHRALGCLESLQAESRVSRLCSEVAEAEGLSSWEEAFVFLSQEYGGSFQDTLHAMQNTHSASALYSYFEQYRFPRSPEQLGMRFSLSPDDCGGNS